MVEKLRHALFQLKELQATGSIHESSAFTGNNLQILKKTGYLKPIIRGWYYQSRPNDLEGDSTPWYASYWEFVSKYLNLRFKDNYILNPESSLLLHTGHTLIPNQLVVVTKEGSINTVKLSFENKIFIYQDAKRFPDTIERINNINVYSLAASLCLASPQFYLMNREEIEIGFGMIKDVSVLLNFLLNNDHMDARTGRIAGALKYFGRIDEAQRVIRAYNNANLTSLSISNPFESSAESILSIRSVNNPYSLRLQTLWNKWVKDINDDIKLPEPGITPDISKLLIELDSKYTNDAYHSLSIEGYKVTEEMINKISKGNWNPDENTKEVNTMAAKGYYLAFQEIKSSITKILNNKSNTINIIESEHHKWYESMFTPSVQAGILDSYHLAGYRNNPVYIKSSSHVPFPHSILVDSMNMYFTLLKNEVHPLIKAILSHHLFVYIHPYMDGNGRMTRFIMNTLLVTSGYPWLIIKNEDRNEYMNCLEEASVKNNIIPFAQFILKQM